MILNPLHIVLIDDDPFQSQFWKIILERKYKDRIQVETYNDPNEALSHLQPGISLLLIDWIMPNLDGAQVLKEAQRRGVDSSRIIILSGRPADELHKRFDIGECLAVIEKGEPNQETALFAILDELVVGLPQR